MKRSLELEEEDVASKKQLLKQKLTDKEIDEIMSTLPSLQTPYITQKLFESIVESLKEHMYSFEDIEVLKFYIRKQILDGVTEDGYPIGLIAASALCAGVTQATLDTHRSSGARHDLSNDALYRSLNLNHKYTKNGIIHFAGPLLSREEFTLKILSRYTFVLLSKIIVHDDNKLENDTTTLTIRIDTKTLKDTYVLTILDVALSLEIQLKLLGNPNYITISLLDLETVTIVIENVKFWSKRVMNKMNPNVFSSIFCVTIIRKCICAKNLNLVNYAGGEKAVSGYVCTLYLKNIISKYNQNEIQFDELMLEMCALDVHNVATNVLQLSEYLYDADTKIMSNLKGIDGESVQNVTELVNRFIGNEVYHFMEVSYYSPIYLTKCYPYGETGLNIDFSRSFPNNVNEGIRLLGKCSSRAICLDIILNFLRNHKVAANESLALVCVYFMFSFINPIGCGRHDLRKSQMNNYFATCTSHNPVQTMVDAAVFGSVDKLKAMSSCIAFGKRVHLGTGVVTVMGREDLGKELQALSIHDIKKLKPGKNKLGRPADLILSKDDAAVVSLNDQKVLQETKIFWNDDKVISD